MDALISSVVPPVGVYCLTTIHNSKPRQKFFTDINDLVAAGLAASDAGQNAYYAMASFEDDTGRTQDNVLALKAFWLDVDCKDKDPSKDYANKEDGIAAIQAFCKKHSFPRPTIVDSGNGWHVYWALTESVDRATWQPVATALKSLCLQDGLRIDPACTADSARILRIPNTKNYRFDPPSDVRIVLQSSEVFFDAFKGIIEAASASVGVSPKALIAGTPSKKQMSAVTAALLGNNTSTFKKIMQKCAAGTGCDQITYCVENQATLEEPMWRGVLSVAQHCMDGAKAVIFVSNQHPEFDQVATIRKAQDTKGPYTCATFDGLRGGVCTNCPHWGKITSPIQLGKEVIAASGPTVVEIPAAPKPVPVQDDASHEIQDVDMQAADAHLAAFHHNMSNLVIPQPPQPYLRGQHGGLYKRSRLEDGTFDDVLIYENDFYPHARLFDPIDGQVLACRLHTPMDGIRNFNIPLRSVGSKDELRKIVCSQGVAATDKTVAELSFYLIACTKELQQMHKEEKARTQMGWQDDGSFVIGSREYSKTGIRHCPPSCATQNYQHMFRMEGSLEEWRKVVDVYQGKGFETHQFIFINMLSSPLLKQMNIPGILTSMISDESGIGKSTLGWLCNSVWGQPEEMTSMPHDTLNAVVNRLGVYNSLGVYIDEFTNKAPEVCSEIAYMFNHGRGKNRMAASANVERVNSTTWAQNGLASANAALRDKIASIKASSEGENMRLLEFDMRGSPVLDKEFADSVFPLMKTNYGVAGHIFASWLVANKDHLNALVNKTRREMDKRFKFTSKERLWSAAIAATYTTWIITKQLGLHNFDLNNNIRHMQVVMEDMRNQVKQSVVQFDGIIADFLAEHHSSILVIDGKPDINGLYPPPKNRVINRIEARYEPDTERLYILSTVLRNYCANRQFSYNSLMKLTGGVHTIKRITSGSGVVAPAARVVEFDTKAAGLDMSGLWADATENP